MNRLNMNRRNMNILWYNETSKYKDSNIKKEKYHDILDWECVNNNFNLILENTILCIKKNIDWFAHGKIVSFKPFYKKRKKYLKLRIKRINYNIYGKTKKNIIGMLKLSTPKEKGWNRRGYTKHRIIQ